MHTCRFVCCTTDRWQSKICGCRKQCLDVFAANSEMHEKINSFQKKLEDLKPVDKTVLVFDMLRRAKAMQQGMGNRDGMIFLGQPVCMSAFQILTQSSKTYINRLVQAIDSGAVTPPTDGRSLREQRESPQTASANGFFLHLYENLAEPLAETILPDPDDDGDHELHRVAVASEAFQKGERAKDDFNEFILAEANPVVALGVPNDDREQRWIPHCTLADLYDQYCFSFVSRGETPCSQSVFNKCWKDKWCGVIRIRRVSQHAQCDSCAKYKAYRQAAKTEEDKENVQKAYRKHLAQVFADRDLAGSYIKHAELSAKGDTTIPFRQRTLMISLDGMDQAGVLNGQSFSPDHGSTLVVFVVAMVFFSKI